MYEQCSKCSGELVGLVKVTNSVENGGEMRGQCMNKDSNL